MMKATMIPFNWLKTRDKDIPQVGTQLANQNARVTKDDFRLLKTDDKLVALIEMVPCLKSMDNSIHNIQQKVNVDTESI